jgi:hypothetical protein
LAEFLEFFDDEDDITAEFTAEEGHSDEGGIFVAVADDEGAFLVLEGEAGEQFGFGPDFEAELVGLSRVEDFLYDFTQLVDFDGEDTAVGAAEVEFGDGLAESLVNVFDAVSEDILEPDQKGEAEVTAAGFFDDIVEVDGCAAGLEGAGDDLAFLVYVKVLGPPPVDIVVVAGGLDGPGCCFRKISAHRAYPMGRTIETQVDNSIRWMVFLWVFGMAGGLSIPESPVEGVDIGVEDDVIEVPEEDGEAG